jgi:hypothetical protein
LLPQCLEPLGANQRGEQIEEEEDGYYGGHIVHSNTSDIFASNEKRIT